MDWFLYDRNLRHERVNGVLDVWQGSTYASGYISSKYSRGLRGQFKILLPVKLSATRGAYNILRLTWQISWVEFIMVALETGIPKYGKM